MQQRAHRAGSDAPRRKLARPYVIAVLILPTSALLGQDAQHSAGGLYAMAKWQLQLTANYIDHVAPRTNLWIVYENDRVLLARRPTASSPS